MKRLLLIATSLITLISAEYIEVKTSEGKAGVLITSKPKLYVCYNKRVKVVSGNTIYLRYDGCARYVNSCKSNHKARFGKYPSIYAAKKALKRCIYANPRFID